MTTTDGTRARCPLCAEADGESFCADTSRRYLHCPVCDFVFVPPDEHLSEAEEKARYDFHENNPNDPGYRKFLTTLAAPLIPLLPPGAHGLDFGCGSGPTLSLLFEEAGFAMDLYDKYYRPRSEVFSHTYDFITASEVIEHLREPGTELRRLVNLLRPGGLLGLMTRLRPEPARFETWYYRNDPTHIGFFSLNTVAWLAHHLGAERFPAPTDVIILRKR